MGWTEDASWRPIETAPQDGTRVDLLIPYCRDRFTEAQCTDKGFWEPLQGYDRADIAWVFRQWGIDAGGCWRFDGDDGGFDIQPTHWRPVA